MSPLDRKLFRDLWRMRGQVLAIALVMACGIATVVLSAGTLRSVLETRDAYYERYRFADVFAQAERAPQSLARRLASIHGVAGVETRIAQDVILDMPLVAEPVRGRVISLPEGRRPRLNDVALRSGRDLEPGATDEILVNETFAIAHALAPGDSLVANLNGHQRTLRIVGIALSPEFVYALAPGALVPDNRRFGVLWMGEEAAAAAFDLDGAFNDVSLSLTRGASEPAVIDAVDDLLARFGGVGAFGRRDHVSDAFLRSETDQLANLLQVIPPIILGVAAFLLNLVMSRLIETEREQVGLLKAFGYSNWAVGWHYLKFVLTIAAISTVLGCLVGAWLGRGMTDMYTAYFHFPILLYRLDPPTVAAAVLVGLAAGVVGATTAVRRAVRLAPAVAMRPPAPTGYRTGLLERMGVTRLLDQPTRMILRHIFRWPLRSALTVCGIALAAALLIGTMFFLDSVDVMLDVQFFQSQRQDVTLTFTQARTDDTSDALAHLPGVIAVEPFRSVAARVRFEHRSRRLGITGLEAAARLQRPIDAHGRTIDLPPDGLVMTAKLAELLGVSVGDRVTVETLEDRRRTATVPVRDLTDEFVGLAAYMSRPALNRLMGESSLASGAHLLIDTAEAPALYQELKDTPVIQSVTVQQSALDQFSSLLEESILLMVTVYVGLASLIAAGVVYSSARISLSERGRELASLRVLGFSKGEIAYIFLGGLSLLVAAALPIGCVMGYGLATLMVQLFDTELYRLPLAVEPSTYGFAALVVLVATTLTGLAVSRRLARLDLIAVLKTRE